MRAIAELVSKIRQGSSEKKVFITIRTTTKILEVLWLFYKEGYICGYKIEGKLIKIYLKYIKGKRVGCDFSQISKISKRVYVKKNTVLDRGIYSGYIVTTVNGLCYEQSKIKNGGELLIKIN